MPTVAHHAPGSFSWFELATTDQDAAKHFYTSLFGWTFYDSPMGPNDFYTTFQLDGQKVGATYTLQQDQLAIGVPPHWNLYIAVESADAAVARALELDGKVLGGPFDVSTHGRMAFIADPTGAAFSVWQAGDHPGVSLVGEPGAVCWADLSTPDQATAAAFYRDLFGYTLPPGEGGYLHIRNGEAFIGGMLAAAQRDPNAPPHWLVYIQVEDSAVSTAKAKELGASIFAGPVEIPNAGTLTVLADPQGAVFALFQPARSGETA